MKVALPISHLIDCHNVGRIPCGAYELRDGYEAPSNVLHSGRDLHWHTSLGCMKENFLFDFSNWAKSWGSFVVSYSCTLGPAVRNYTVSGGRYKSTNGRPPMEPDDIYKWFRAVANRMKEIWPNGIIAFENTNGYPYPEYAHIADPDFINDLIVEADVGFILDLAHAVVTVNRMNESGRAINAISLTGYLNRLPLDRVVGVHLSRPGIEGGNFKDLHGYPDAWVFKALCSIKDRLPIDCYVAIEYYGVFELLEQAYQKLKEILK